MNENAKELVAMLSSECKNLEDVQALLTWNLFDVHGKHTVK